MPERLLDVEILVAAVIVVRVPVGVGVRNRNSCDDSDSTLNIFSTGINLLVGYAYSESESVFLHHEFMITQLVHGVCRDTKDPRLQYGRRGGRGV